MAIASAAGRGIRTRRSQSGEERRSTSKEMSEGVARSARARRPRRVSRSGVAPLRRHENTGPIAVWQVQANSPGGDATAAVAALGSIPDESGHPKRRRMGMATGDDGGRRTCPQHRGEEVVDHPLARDSGRSRPSKNVQMICRTTTGEVEHVLCRGLLGEAATEDFGRVHCCASSELVRVHAPVRRSSSMIPHHFPKDPGPLARRDAQAAASAKEVGEDGRTTACRRRTAESRPAMRSP